MARDKGPIVVAVINLKGGVGKSTISALISRRAFATRKLDVLAVDLDPQANLSQSLMRGEYKNFLSEQRPSIVELFNGYRPPSASSGGPSRLVPSEYTQTIAESEGRSFQIIPSRFDFSDNLIGAVRPDPKILARLIADQFSHKDIIIIDCAPTESILTMSAYHASSKVLVPVKPEYFATIGFPLLHESLDNFRNQNRGHNLSVCGIVINNAFYDGGNDGGPEKSRALEEIRREAGLNNWPIYRNEIPHSRGFPKMMRGDYSYPGNAVMFRYFADEFFNSINV